MADDAEIEQREKQEKAEGSLVGFLDRIDGEAEAAKRSVSKNWTENLRLSRGDGQWKSSRPPLFLMNIIGNQVERKVAQVSESKPTFSVVSRLGHLANMAKVLDKTCRAKLEDEEFPLLAERLGRFGMHMGCGFVSTVWDVDGAEGLGDIALLAPDPRSVFIDPAVTEAAKVSRQARYIRLDHVVSLDELRERYPGRGTFAKPDERYSRYSDLGTKGKLGVISAAFNLLPRVFRPQEPTVAGPVARTVLREYWIRDADRTTWPGGRHVIRAGDVILKDEANPYWDGQFPIDMIDWRMDLDGPWGVDDIQDLKKLNEALNRLGDAVMRNALFNSQAWVIADHDALDPEAWKKVTSEGGLIVKKRPTREFRRDPPPALPAYLFQLLQAIPGMADLLTGNAEVPRGRSARSSIEAVVDGLQTAGSALARIIARRFESLVARVGAKLISRVLQCYTDDRLLQYYDPSGELVSYLFERQKLLVDDRGEYTPVEDIPLLYKRFRFLVQPYSSMAMTKMQRAQVGIGLWQASGGRGYPFRRVLEMADIGDAERLMEEARKEQESGVVPMPAPPTKR